MKSLLTTRILLLHQLARHGLIFRKDQRSQLHQIADELAEQFGHLVRVDEAERLLELVQFADLGAEGYLD